MKQTLHHIFRDTGISLIEITHAAQMKDDKIVKTRLEELVKMYEDHPEKLDKLINSMVNQS